MSKRNLIFVSVFTAILVLAIVPLSKSQMTVQSNDTGIVAGRNVNMVRDDPFLQRQNEPSLAVSTLNSRHLLAGANDYHLVDLAGLTTEEETTDAWLGAYMSYDGGQSWHSELVPGYELSHDSPLAGFDAAADPTVRAGLDGWFFYNGIAFDREDNGASVIFVARYRDNGGSIDYYDTTIIDTGTSGQFSDKPWIGVDQENRVYIVYSIFLGQIDNNIHSKIMIARSFDGGDNWEAPTKLSESQLKNQGTTIAVDAGGDIYVAWRRFTSPSAADAILIAKSENHGTTFTKAEEVAIIEYPFDQPTEGSQWGMSQFRTNSYPTIAMDNDRIYLAWSQRTRLDGDAHIVLATQAKSAWGGSWNGPDTVEDPGIHGHQIMPTMVYGSGKLMLAWFDTRFSARRYDVYGQERNPLNPETSPWIRDNGAIWNTRETIDVRLAQATPGENPVFDESIQVSRYLWVLEGPDVGGYFTLRQGQFNPPNYKMFSGGTVPFHGDYIDIAHSPDDPFTFYVSWTDNRDVRPPDEDGWWDDYIPPVVFDPDSHSGECDSPLPVGMRNQSIYCSKITRGIEIGALNNNQAPGNNAFVVFIDNQIHPGFPVDPNSFLTFDLTILGGAEASFSPFEPDNPDYVHLTSITAQVPFYSTAVRQVFVNGSAGDTISIQVTAEDLTLGLNYEDFLNLKVVNGGILPGTGDLVLNGTTKIDWNNPDGSLVSVPNPSITNISASNDFITNPSITNPSITNPSITNPSITNPSITNPSITNPSITNPSITNPSITNPSITNPSITNPSITNPSITNPSITNPSITNPSITNMPPGGEGVSIADKVWSVHNAGDSVAAYTFKGIAGDTLPPDEYIYSQLIIYKVHYTHATNDCYLLTEASHELLYNVLNPNITTNITNLDIETFLGDPEAYNTAITNATFFLAPLEHAVLMLRIIDTKHFRTKQLEEMSILNSFKIQEYDESLVAAYTDDVDTVVVEHNSTTSNPAGSASVFILPETFPLTVKAGVEYLIGSPIMVQKAIGGTLEDGSDYSWTVLDGIPLEWGLIQTGNILYGNSRWIGHITFTLQANDDFVDPNPDYPDRAHFDTHTFSGEIFPPDPLTLEMTIHPGFEPDEDGFYHGAEGEVFDGLVTFTASQGVAPYFPTLTGASFLSLIDKPGGNPGEMILVGTLVAGEWDFTVTLTDSRLPEEYGDYIKSKTFTLCVAPPALVLNVPDAEDLVWSLGTEKTVQLSVGNAKGQPVWSVINPEGLPDGFSLGTANSPVDLTGLPVFDPTVDYPVTYTVTVKVLDPFTWCNQGPRYLTATFDITVNPKAPDWYSEETNLGVATAVTSDPDGNTYVTGYTGPEGNRDYYTVKYGNASEGASQSLWQKTYIGPAGGDDVPTAIAADATGVYVTGISMGLNSGDDIYTIKYDPNGNLIWEERYDGPSHMGDKPNAMALDGSHLYIAGFVHRGNKTAHKDYTVVKYDKDDGDEIWDATYDSTRNGMDEATAVAVDNLGSVYVTGKSQESSLKGDLKSFDFLTVKYNSSGKKLLWQVRDDCGPFGDDEPTAIAVDAAGNVYVTGQNNVSTDNTDFYTVKYNTDGQPVWTTGQSYGGSFEDRAVGVAFDDDGNVYVTGKLISSDGFVDYATIRYSSDAGVEDWDEVYSSGNGIDAPVGLAFAVDGETGFVFVAGFKTTESNGKDFFSIKYDASDGSIAWVAQHNSETVADDEATAMFMDATGLYVTGFSPKGFLTVKYSKWK